MVNAPVMPFRARSMRPVKIAGLSTYVPPKLLTNEDLEKMVETSNEWILQRTGIRERHIAGEGVATSDLAKEASLGAMAEARVTADQLGFIVVGTTTPDTIFPSTACMLQDKLGAHHSWGFDLGAACSGFTYSLTVGMQMVSSGAHDHALVVGADVMSSIIDYTDRTTCVLFGDGAGAIVLSPAGADEPHIIDFEHEIDGSGGHALCMPAGGSRLPASHQTVDKRLHYVKQEGQTVFKFAVKKTEEISRRLLSRNGLQPGDLDLFVSHQANRRIIEASTERLGLGPDKVDHQPRALRQHHRGNDPAGARRRTARGTAEEGGPRSPGVGRRGFHRGRGALAVEFVVPRTSALRPMASDTRSLRNLRVHRSRPGTNTGRADYPRVEHQHEHRRRAGRRTATAGRRRSRRSRPGRVRQRSDWRP